MLLYDEVEKQVKEEQYEKISETKTGMKYKTEDSVDKNSSDEKSREQIRDYTKDTAYKVAQKVRD
jgi:hypothetical protein